MEKTYKLIVARYNENLDWVNEFESFQIYNKGAKDLAPHHQANAVQLPNVGREAHTHLYHIIQNYNSLEDVLIFSQGSFAPHTYHQDVKEFKRRALNIDDFGFSVDLGNTSSNVGDNTANFTLHGHGGKLYYMGADGKTHDASMKPYFRLGEWWERVAGEKYTKSSSVYWGATFSVKKEFILKRSLDGYKRIFASLCGHRSPLEAHFCERTWFNILNLPLNFSFVSGHAPPPKKVFGVKELFEAWPKDSVGNKKIRVKFNDNSPPKTLSKDELIGVLDDCGDLLFKDEETMVRYAKTMTENIKNYKRIRCPELPEKSFLQKDDLEEKDKWFVKELDAESMVVQTSGTTSGLPFKYKRWHASFHKIEWDYHYNLVLDEFNVPQDYSLLYFFSSHYKTDGDKFIFCPGGKSELAMNNHGSSRNPTVHYVNFQRYSAEPEEFFKYLFNYIKENPIDVFFTSSPQVNSLCNYIKKFGIKEKMGYLLSNTANRLLNQDARFLMVDNNYFDHMCDHMRCWDGGASFFTCKHRNYHLMDNISWAEEADGKLLCTDYFNLASPFHRYWNGDYCSISDKYQRCECGRLYREFEFLESRPFSLKGTCLNDIKNQIKAMEIPDIRQVRCSVDFLDLVSSRELSEEEKATISASTDKFVFRFFVEADHT